MKSHKNYQTPLGGIDVANMIHFITEGGNKELKNRRWYIPDGIRSRLESIKEKYKDKEVSSNPTTNKAYQHLLFVLDSDGIEYNEMKRMKNWFEKNKHAIDTPQYEMYGGTATYAWVNNALSTATMRVKNNKEALHNAGINTREKDTRDRSKVTKVDQRTPCYNPATGNKKNRLKELTDIREHHVIVITESQYNEIVGFYNEVANELNRIITPDRKHEDIVKELAIKYGQPIGVGSERVVFALNEMYVIKYSYRDGNRQNKNEVTKPEKFKKMYHVTLFPEVIVHADDYSWIICERAKPLNKSNVESTFKSLYGISAISGPDKPSFKSFVEWCYNPTNVTDEVSNFFSEKCMSGGWFEEMQSLILCGGCSDVQFANFGIVNRDDGDTIVCIDCGI